MVSGKLRGPTQTASRVVGKNGQLEIIAERPELSVYDPHGGFHSSARYRARSTA
jgi:hypothetical protein